MRGGGGVPSISSRDEGIAICILLENETMSQFTLVKGNKLARAVTTVLKQAANLRLNLHSVLVSSLVAACEDDTEHLETILNVLPAGERHSKVIKWARGMADVSIKCDDGQWSVTPGSDASDYDLDLMVATPYYSLASDDKKKSDPRGIDSLYRSLERFMSPKNADDVSPEAKALAFEIIAKFDQFKKFVK